MDKNITTIFLSIALTIAFTQLVSMSDADSYIWWFFAYFIFRKVSYYAFDVRFADLTENIFKKESKMERMFNFFFGISTLFFFIVTGYFIIMPAKFLLFNSVALFINIAWLIVLRITIDKDKDKNPELPIRTIFRNFIIINAVEILFCLVGGLLLISGFSLNNVPNEQMQHYIYIITLSALFFIFIIDTLLHKNFLFDPSYKTY